ncbi:hypothetical protein CYLTODRAFT_419804 [Cylindrobasidium torrendii FP15055 ss-10]|uniref:Homeodomain-like protein n=1 Tax=Cylindrobasidium torrendii FP15055 ss-10 TaxID=1314674 RepID=A0A0D7BK18_9AGAR|nr:hypothetical protein CYLTODRAFT_419804 [Cylindrobasidium torrendii FP15055 ss-10]
MLSRERRSWTTLEDQQLRDAVSKEDPNTQNPSKWHAIAKHVPERTNKDCRKRWFAKMASDVVKGGWAPDEDERLVGAIERFGTRWSLVASVVGTRNSDQCAKRWTDTLNPAIDRTSWTPEADTLLLRAVNEHGKLWTKIVKTYFPGRTGLAAKNRYNSITRFNSDRTRRPSKAGSTSSSSSSSSSVSPVTPHMSIPASLPSKGFDGLSNLWTDIASYTNQSSAFSNDALIGYSAHSPYDTLPSPFSDSGYHQYAQPQRPAYSVAQQDWPTSQWDNFRSAVVQPQVGYLY